VKSKLSEKQKTTLEQAKKLNKILFPFPPKKNKNKNKKKKELSL